MARILKKALFFFLLSTPGFFIAPVNAQTLDEYKSAADKKGCDSIPFSTLRSNCNDSEREKDKWCYEEKWKCERDTEGLVSSINGMKKKLADLNDQRYHASSDDERSKIDNEIKDISDRRDKFLRQLEDERKDISERVERGKKCLEARKKTQEIFKDAITQAKNESDQDKKPYAEKLVSYWESERSRHDDEIEKVSKGIEKCEEIYKKRED